MDQLTTTLDLERRLLELVLHERRLVDDADPCLAAPCSACFAPHLAAVRAFVARDQPVHFILPAFPAKSPNLSKVLGALPDLGERISLRNLNELCAQIGRIYPPGARITICSDGRVFSDCVGVSDEDVSSYGRHIRSILEDDGLRHLDVFNLEDHFQEGDFDAIRHRLIHEHGRSVDELRELLKVDDAALTMFNGIHRFMYTDLKARRGELSNTKLRNESKELAYAVVIRSNAWSALVERLFPGALRMSIHPQRPHGRKLGIKLMECDDVWRTPWHGAVLDDGKQYRLMSRSEIEKLPVDLVYQQGRPLYYVLRRYA